MAAYAILVPPFVGHLNPDIVLARALRARGHRIVFVSAFDAEERVRAGGFGFIPVATEEFPAGAWDRMVSRNAELTGLSATAYICSGLSQFARGVLRELPGIIERERFDGVILDHVAVGGESVCHAMKIPMAVACTALIFHFESGLAPTSFPWPPAANVFHHARNLAAQMVMNGIGMRLIRHLVPYRLKHRLPRMRFDHGSEMPPSLVQVSQQPPFFDFPRKKLPDHFHYTGPWVDDAVAEDDRGFPWEKLDGRPLIYASMGTLQNRLQWVFRAIAEACAGMDAQLAMGLGSKSAEVPKDLPGKPIAVGYAPQRALLKRASLVITHAGLNTTLETLREGVPMVALPVTNDQPGVAARLRHLGVGEFIPAKRVTGELLRETIAKVWNDPTYRMRAQQLAEGIRQGGGAAEAAELIERALTTRQRITKSRAL